MPLLLNRDSDKDFEVSRVKFSRKENLFIVYDKLSEESLEFKYSLRPDDKFKTTAADFTLFLFHKDSFAANDIFQIKVQGYRLGWLFPIQALLTSEHDYAANEHFFPYAFNSYRILLANRHNFPYSRHDLPNNFGLEDIYGENTILFVVYNKYLKEFNKAFRADFNIDNYLLFLYQHGYTFLSPTNFNNFLYLKQANAVPQTFSSKVVELQRVSSFLDNDKPYLNSLIQGLIKLEKHPLVKFHLLYSVVELFISKIFEFDFKASVNSFMDSANFYDAKENLSKLTNEKDRINKLFNSRSPGLDSSLLNELMNSCNSFLSFVYTPKVFKKAAGPALYKVRSTIFHNLRYMPDKYELELEKVLISFEALLVDISIKMKLG